MKTAVRIIFVIIINTLLLSQLNAQTPGLIYKPANATGALVLDPNGDGYISQDELGFQSNDVAESEIPFVAVPVVALEPDADPGPGPDYRFNDITDLASDPNNAVFIYIDGNENLLVRFRLGGSSPNTKSYNLVIDTDSKFGFTGPNADPNAVVGNPGFEIEVHLVTNFGVGLSDVDGTTSPVIIIDRKDGTLPYEQHAHKAVAISTNNDDIDVFYDFYIPFSYITANFPDVTTSTPLRFLFATSMNPHPVIGNSAASDLGGIDDSEFDYNYDAMFDLLVGKLDPISISDLGAGNPVKLRTNCPYISSYSETDVSGTYEPELNYTTELSKGLTTTISLYTRNGAIKTWVADVDADVPTGAWSMTGLSLTAGDTIIAEALAFEPDTDLPQYGASYDNCDYAVIGATCSAAPIGGDSGVGDFTKNNANKGVIVDVDEPIGTAVYMYNSDGTLFDASILSTGSTNPVITTTSPQIVNFLCQSGQCFSSGVYYFSYEEPGLCESDQTPFCFNTSGSTTTPVITTDPLLITTTSLVGTSASDAIIKLYIDDVETTTFNSIEGIVNCLLLGPLKTSCFLNIFNLNYI